VPELKISFSHDYYKLPAGWEFGTSAKLMAVVEMENALQMKQLVDYDTEIRPEHFTSARQFYPLQSGKHLLLLFKHQGGAVFTTIRRYTLDKWNYYQGNVGNDFTLKRVTE
jgi:hypothetical protein